jgi:hypothetical protein
MITAGWYGDAIVGSGSEQSERRMTCCSGLVGSLPAILRVKARPLSELAYRPEADSQAQPCEDYLCCDPDYPSEIFFKVI